MVKFLNNNSSYEHDKVVAPFIIITINQYTISVKNQKVILNINLKYLQKQYTHIVSLLFSKHFKKSSFQFKITNFVHQKFKLNRW